MYVGKTQNPMVIILLTLVTGGLFMIYWTYTAIIDVNKLTGKEAVNPILGAIIAIYGWYIIDKELVEIYKAEGLPERKPGFVMWLLLCLVCGIGSYVAIYQMVNSFNEIWAKRGGTPSGSTGV